MISVPCFPPYKKKRKRERKGGREIRSTECKQPHMHPSKQAAHPAKCINMNLNNSDFQTTGRGFPVGGKGPVIKVSPAHGGSCFLQQTEKIGHGLIAQRTGICGGHCWRTVRFILVFPNYKVNSLDTSFFYILIG